MLKLLNEDGQALLEFIASFAIFTLLLSSFYLFVIRFDDMNEVSLRLRNFIYSVKVKEDNRSINIKEVRSENKRFPKKIVGIF